MRDYSLHGEDSRLAVERGLSTAEWFKPPVPRARMKQLMARRDGPAIRDTAIWLGLLAVFGAIGATFWFSWISLVSFALYGVLYGSASDSRWHECGHGTAFKTRWMNTAVYNIACFMIMRDPTVWRWSHTRHHTDTIIVGRDPEIVLTRPPRFGLIALNFVGLIDVPRAFRHMFLHAAGKLTQDEPTFIPATEHHKVYRAARIWLIIYAAMIVTCFATRSILPAMFIGLPRLYGAWHHLLTGLVQHGGLAEDVVDHRLNSRTVYINPLSRFVYWNMNYHVEHHLFPMVPFHALPALHKELAGTLAAANTSLVDAYREMLPALARQRREPGYTIRKHLLDGTPLTPGTLSPTALAPTAPTTTPVSGAPV